MLVQRFEPQGRRFTNFHYYYCTPVRTNNGLVADVVLCFAQPTQGILADRYTGTLVVLPIPCAWPVVHSMITCRPARPGYLKCSVQSTRRWPVIRTTMSPAPCAWPLSPSPSWCLRPSPVPRVGRPTTTATWLGGVTTTHRPPTFCVLTQIRKTWAPMKTMTANCSTTPSLNVAVCRVLPSSKAGWSPALSAPRNNAWLNQLLALDAEL